MNLRLVVLGLVVALSLLPVAAVVWCGAAPAVGIPLAALIVIFAPLIAEGALAKQRRRQQPQQRRRP